MASKKIGNSQIDMSTNLSILTTIMNYHFITTSLTRFKTVQQYKVLVTQLCPGSLSMGVHRQEYWSGQPFPPPGNRPDPGIGPGSPKLQAYSLPSETPGKPIQYKCWEGFPGGACGKEPTCQCRRHERCGFHPWVGKIRGRRAWQLTPVFLPVELEELQGQRSLAGYSLTLPSACERACAYTLTHTQTYKCWEECLPTDTREGSSECIRM